MLPISFTPLNVSKTKTAVFSRLLWLSAAEAAASFVWLAVNLSRFGFSTGRLLLAGVALLLSLGLGAMVYHAQPGKSRLRHLYTRLDACLNQGGKLIALTVFLLIVFVFALLIILLFTTSLSYRLQDWLFPYPLFWTRLVDIGRALFQRAYPLVGWAGVVALQSFIMLCFVYPKQLKQGWQDGTIYRALLIVLAGTLALFHWVVLVFQLKVFLVIRAWKWYFTEKPLAENALLVLLGLVVALFVVTALVVRAPRPFWRSLLFLVALGYVIQVGFVGFVEGGGFENIRLKYADSIFNGYALAAAEQPPMLDALRQYEVRYGADRYLGTKPPGILIPYLLTQRLADIFNPQTTPAGRFIAQTALAARLYPLIAFLLPAALFFLARRLVQPEEDALLPGLVYVAVPSVILIPLFLDQVLYPLLFVLVLWLVQQSLHQPSFGWGLASGAAMVLAWYFSFSLLPLLPLAGLWIVLEGWRRGEGWLLSPQRRRVLAGLAAGILALTLALGVLLNYNPIFRFSRAIANHQTTHTFNTPLERALNALELNSAEQAAYGGFPLVLLVLSRMGRAGLAFLRRRAVALDGLALATLATYLMMNVFGSTNGETQRLFLFLMPLFSLFAAEEAKTLFRYKDMGFYYILALQLTTAVLLYHFQDFYG